MISMKKLALLSVAILAMLSLCRPGRTDQTWNVTYTNTYAEPGALLINVSPNVGNPGPFPVLAYCVDRYSYVGVPSTATVQTTLDPIHTNFLLNQYTDNLWLNPNLPGWTESQAQAQWGRVSWIYDQYGKNAGQVGSVQAQATQLAIWGSLGEFGAYTNSLNQSFGTLDPHAYGPLVSAKYDEIMLASAGQSANDAYFLARTPAGGYPGQALIAEVTPEGDTLWMIAMGTIPMAVVPLMRKRRKPAK